MLSSLLQTKVKYGRFQLQLDNLRVLVVSKYPHIESYAGIFLSSESSHSLQEFAYLIFIPSLI